MTHDHQQYVHILDFIFNDVWWCKMVNLEKLSSFITSRKELEPNVNMKTFNYKNVSLLMI